MNRNEMIKLSYSTIEWLSKEVTEIENYIRMINEGKDLSDDEYLYDESDLDFLEIRLDELDRRTKFETKNLKYLKESFF